MSVTPLELCGPQVHAFVEGHGHQYSMNMGKVSTKTAWRVESASARATERQYSSTTPRPATRLASEMMG